MTRQVVGLHACKEVLSIRPQEVVEVYLRKDYERSAELSEVARVAKSRGLKVLKKDETALKKIAASHQGVCVVVRGAPQLDFEDFSDDPNDPIVLMGLDEVSDPHNVGAILRTAWLTGAQGLLVTDRRAAHLTPAVCKVACGGAEHIPLVVSKNLGSDLSYLKEKGFWIFGLAAGDKSRPIFELDLPPRTVWLVGSEEKGLRSSSLKLCDEIVSIPQKSAAASYNASVAAGMALFESLRQRQKH